MPLLGRGGFHFEHDADTELSEGKLLFHTQGEHQVVVSSGALRIERTFEVGDLSQIDRLGVSASTDLSFP